MTDPSFRLAVQQFLEQFKEIAAQKGFDVVPREKNKQTLITLGFTAKIRKEILMGLTADDYISGPEPDRDRKGDVWVFGITIGSTEIYIKLKVVEYTPIDSTEVIQQAICLSFHVTD